MEIKQMFKSVDRVAAHLPFSVKDTEQANAAFEAWRTTGDAEAKRLVDLWTYCFVRRYLLVKFAANRSVPAADLEQLFERVYRRVDRKRVTVQDASRYASWVSVVCKNAFYNYLRSAGRVVLFGADDDIPVLVSEPREPVYDTVLLLEVLHAAVEALPPYLRTVGYLRFIRGMAYSEIADETGHELPIVRSYVSKAARRLRRNHALVRILGRDPEKIGE